MRLLLAEKHEDGTTTLAGVGVRAVRAGGTSLTGSEPNQ